MERQIIYEPGFQRSYEKHLAGIGKKQKVAVEQDLAKLLGMLVADSQSIPSRYKVHKLPNKGGLFEAHLGGRGSDSLLLFRKGIEDGEPILYLVRICTHYELDLVRAMAEDEDAIITAAYCAELLD